MKQRVLVRMNRLRAEARFGWRLALLACVALVAALGLWWWMAAPRGLPAPAVAAGPAVAMPMQREREASPPAVPASAVPRVASARPAFACGRGLMRGGSGESGAGADASNVSFPELFHQVELRLLASVEPGDRAAGLLLGATGLTNVPVECSGDECADALHQRQQTQMAQLDELVAMARNSRSPEIYAWAWLACGRAEMLAGKPAACGNLSAQRWVELAPDKAWAWLALAGESAQRGDTSGQETAMNGASLARNWSGSGSELMRRFSASWPASLSAASRQQLPQLQLLLRNSLDVSLSFFGAVSRFCPAEQDANRRQLCNRLSENMLDSADNLLQMSVAIGIGQRSGWPPARLKSAREELDALKAAWPTLVFDERTGALDCAQELQRFQLMNRSIEVGELQALRERRRQ